MLAPQGVEALCVAPCVLDLAPALPGPIGRDVLDRLAHGLVSGRVIGQTGLAAVPELRARADQMRKQNNRRVGATVGRAELVAEPERIGVGIQGRRPVDAAHQLARCPTRSIGERGFGQPGNTIVVALEQLVSKRRGIAAMTLKILRHVVLAEWSEPLRLDRPRCPLHGPQQPVDQIVVELRVVAQQALERCSLQAYGVEHGLPLAGAGETVELGQEIAQQADRLALAVMRQEGAGEALEILQSVPVRTRRRRWRPLGPAPVERLTRPSLPPPRVDPRRPQGQMRVEIAEAIDDW